MWTVITNPCRFRSHNWKCHKFESGLAWSESYI